MVQLAERTVPGLSLDTSFWAGRRVFVTGHTGFMGGWLCLWLKRLGAEIHGYALTPPTEPSLFFAADLGRDMASTIADVRDYERLSRALKTARPDVVLHLAAQPLVRRAYAEPVETYATNVMGTVNLLEAVRHCPTVRAAIIVTTDKVYDNHERTRGYRETDTLGGREPYGNSKACAEFAVDAYRRSYFRDSDTGIATVRAGNIIGGGDWAQDRLVPDAMRAFDAGDPLHIRHPDAVRPWQHVLEPLGGFLMLAQHLAATPTDWAGGWNFGPDENDARTVSWVADRLITLWGAGASWQATPGDGIPEARLLTLSSAKAEGQLGWRPVWDAGEALVRTVDWYRDFYRGEDVRGVTLAQIEEFERLVNQTDRSHGEKRTQAGTHSGTEKRVA